MPYPVEVQPTAGSLACGACPTLSVHSQSLNRRVLSMFVGSVALPV